ncbi:sulfatase-like hydrolase/transferase [Cognatishimia sp. WU-CL00825]
MATGLHINEVSAWDNAAPYRGQRRSFMHRAQDTKRETVSIGKLHFRNTEDDVGFDQQILPMHVVNGTGTFTSLLRNPLPTVQTAGDLLRNAGAGASPYAAYDQSICDAAVDWLENRSADDAPFLLFVSFTNPHPPYLAEQELFDIYMSRDLAEPNVRDAAHLDHQTLQNLRTYFDIDLDALSAEQIKSITAAYYANITALDRRIGKVLDALRNSQVGDETHIIYTSDHGEALGTHGLYGKCSLLEPSVGVPLIMAGPDMPYGKTVNTPAQLLDIYPTVLDLFDATPQPLDKRRRGRSLRQIAQEPSTQRPIVAQQHCAGATSGVYGVTEGRWKYICTPDADPLLFDLLKDPTESQNLHGTPELAQTEASLLNEIRKVADPVATDIACKQSQMERIVATGGYEAITQTPNAGFTPAPS